MADMKIGARVRIVDSSLWDYNSSRGRVGVVDRIDHEDDEQSWRIVDDAGELIAWAAAVESAITPTPDSREALVTRAKELLADTAHTGADVIAMAAFLADR
ncbi:hypothetical protein AB0D97_14275 [Streptomyces roseus]|uniref:hypothetical protein n=1 Tax=Streptomyces roseus TaxID=66430 RepID=UPI0033EC2F84